MAHFAKMENNRVVNVIVVSNDDCDDLPFPESEPVGQAFLASLGLDGLWLQTSYNANFRGYYGTVDYTFDPLLGEYGEFIPPPQPERIVPVE